MCHTAIKKKKNGKQFLYVDIIDNNDITKFKNKKKSLKKKKRKIIHI